MSALRRKIVTSIATHWPFANGSGRFIDLFGGGVDLGDEQRDTVTSDGAAMRVLSNDLIGRHILLSGGFDRSIVEVLLEQAREGDVLLDVGANIGYVTSTFLTRVSESRAICVEPQPVIVDLLRQNVAVFGDRVAVHEVALSDRSGTLHFSIDPNNRGASRISGTGKTIVEAVDASSFLGAIDRIDLIKIDVEGHELHVLQSMKDQIARLRPRAILFEDHLGQALPGGAIHEVLADVGYGILAIEKHLLKTRLVPVSAVTQAARSDFLAVHG